jgi:hypothetical protein
LGAGQTHHSDAPTAGRRGNRRNSVFKSQS